MSSTRLAVLLMLSAATARRALPQDLARRIDVTVVVAGTSVPLPNSIVEISSLQRVVLTSGQGRAMFADVPAGGYRISIRHIGYSPRDTTVSVATDDATVTLGLSHLAVRLAALTTRSEAACVKTGLPDTHDSATEALGKVLQQIALNAAQQRVLVEQYPFTYTYERTTSPLGVDPNTIRMQVDTLEANGAPRWTYNPGEVYRLEPPTRGTQWKTVLHQPTFISVAEPAFQQEHCFDYVGVEDDAGGRRIRVDFRPATALHETDVEGSIYLDTASYQVTRAVLRFTNLDRAPRASLAALVATSYFEEIAPSISLATLVETQSLLKEGQRIGKTGDQSSGRTLSIQFTKHAPAGLLARWQPDFAATLEAASRAERATASPAASPAETKASAARAKCGPLFRAGVPGIGGIVRDETGAPLPFALLTLEGGYQTQAVANQDGCFYLQLAQSKSYTLVARRIGFKELQRSFQVGDSAEAVDLQLEPVVVVLEGVTTTAPREEGLEKTGFYDRMLDRQKGIGSATFFTPEQLEKRFDHVSDVIAGAPGVHLHFNKGRVLLYGPSAAHIGRDGEEGCPMEIWVDGARVTGIGASTGDTYVDDLVSTNNLAGIEVYTRVSQVPPQYQSVSNGCGAVVIWTKR